MNRAANVKAFRALDVRINQCETDAEAARWEQARLAFEALDAGVTRKDYAEAVGKSPKHITNLCRTWKKFGSERKPLPSDTAFRDAYRMAETFTDDVGSSLARKRGEPVTTTQAVEQVVEQLMADPKVATQAVAKVMAQSSPTRRAVEAAVQTSRAERKAADDQRKAAQADRSALPFSAFLARLGVKIDEWALELQACQPDIEALVDQGYNLDALRASAEHLVNQAEAVIKTIHPELNNIPDNIIDI